jgi:hypothetical protein
MSEVDSGTPSQRNRDVGGVVNGEAKSVPARPIFPLLLLKVLLVVACSKMHCRGSRLEMARGGLNNQTNTHFETCISQEKSKAEKRGIFGDGSFTA